MSENKKQKKYYRQVSLSPFTNKSSTFSTYLMILIAVIPQVIMLFITKSFSNLIIIGTCILACFASEIISIIQKKHINLSILTSFLYGILIGFFLPAGYPPVSVFFITFFTMVLLKYAFSDSYVTWLNPVIVTVICCWFIGQINFPGFQVTRDYLSAKNPSLILIQEGIFPTFKFDEAVTSFLNDSAFSIFGVSIPQGYVSLLWDSGSVIPAFRFNFLTIIASVFLIVSDVFSFEISGIYLVTYLLLVKFLGPVITGGIPMQGDMLLALLSSGTLFTAFFCLQWFGTTPMSIKGKIFFGLIGGIIAFVFAGCGTSPIGSAITILFLNIISPIIQYFENKSNRARIANTLRKENA